MKNLNEIKRLAKNVIELETKSIKNLANFINDDFAKAVQLIYNSKGRVIITGIGKSAIIANKIVATLNSTGTPSVFMHAADAIHGDLGIVLKDDIVICISKSGNTPELKVLIPLIKNRKNKLIALVSNTKSVLAKQSDLVINAYVENEACPNNLAPTSSTTAQLVMGDALAVSLLEYRGFSTQDFAKIHPGGSLGKKLYMRVSDLYPHNNKPKVYLDDSINKVIFEISSNLLGATVVLNKNDELIGIITDGDIRRMLEKNKNIEQLQAKDIMSANPKTINKDKLAAEAFNVMEQNNITQIIVAKELNYLGIVHLHDILKEGIV
ncbi:MAG: KpsF/GutQ family sugar-phosphate isomerase [Chlorobi bacterium]|nr:KpsF/GutQ family sugar-phosphate isomerase [Chlorobiota bacterium]